ncbi:MAG TPA: DUF6382 domain-containing protein [Lachnospiraceae bacterium]|nr:DUF6382 domain-containing protein [Lachnospiraceae bacterium]
MGLEVEYSRDLYHSYLVINEEKNPIDSRDSYQMDMVMNNRVGYLLNLSVACINGKSSYYYDITSKQTIYDVFEKRKLTYEEIKRLALNLVDTFHEGKKYLLNGNHFILEPRYIYYDLKDGNIYIVYYIGFERNYMQQLSDLIEYFMNRVDHTDERAVIFTYSLYQASREENASLTQIAELVAGKLNEKWNEKVSKHSSDNCYNEHKEKQIKIVPKDNVQEESERNQIAFEGRNYLTREDSLQNFKAVMKQKQKFNVIENQNTRKSSVPGSNRIIIPSIQRPVMEERFESERIKMIYPNSCYIKAGFSFLCIVITVGVMLSQGFLGDKVTNEIVFPKVFAVLIIIIACEAYLLSRIFQKEAKVEKVISEVKYIPDNMLQSSSVANRIDHTYEEKKEDKGDRFPIFDSKVQKEDCYNGNGHEALSKNACEEMYEEKTQLLSAIQPDCRYRLKAKDNLRYQDIPLIEFPFFIGKFKMNVDYAIDNTLVSRFHAKISKETDEFFIIDLNSTNGTFLNDVRIEPQKMIPVNLGDSIAFADAVFIFEEVGVSY